MDILKNWVLNTVALVHRVKNENLHFKADSQTRQLQFKHNAALAEQALANELKKKSVALAHEIELMRTQNSAELAMLKTKCKQEVKDYEQYLKSLDQLKYSLQLSYAHLPEAVAFTIHHHAKQLLNQMWEAESFEQKMQYELQLIHFMTTVHEEARLRLSGESAENLPEKTLNLLTRQ